MENSNYISDRCIMDCFAVIKMRMTKEDLDAFTERHKVSRNLNIERGQTLEMELCKSFSIVCLYFPGYFRC